MSGFTPIGQREAIIFRTFDKAKLRDQTLTPSSVSKLVFPNGGGQGVDTAATQMIQTNPLIGPTIEITDLELLNNPYEATWETPQDVVENPSAGRGHYNIQHYGPGLTKIQFRLETGNLLPYKNIDSLPAPSGFTPAPGEIDDLDTRGFLRGITSSGYTGLLLASARFQNFLRFYVLYAEFDASKSILLMTFMRAIFRGYLVNWTFTIDANSPWNWKYGVDFVVMQGLSSWTRSDTNADTALVNNLELVDGVDPLVLPLESPARVFFPGGTPIFGDTSGQTSAQTQSRTAAASAPVDQTAVFTDQLDFTIPGFL